jgi:hypothetical protein
MHRERPEQSADHQSAAPEHHHETSPARTECRITGACDGPLASIFTVLAHDGVLIEPTTAALDIDSRVVSTVVRDHPAGRFEPPDPPPPRA